MKKKISALLVAVLFCMFALTGCVETQQTITDESLISSLQESAVELIETIVGMDDAALEEYIEYYGVDGMSPNSGLLSGLESWNTNKADLGAYNELISFEVVYNTSDKRYIAIAELSFEKRNCEYRMIVTRQLDEIVSQTFNPDFTFGEKMAKAAMNTLMGLGTVFVMLVFISLIIYCFKFINVLEKRNKESEAVSAVSEPAAAVEAVPEEETEELADDLELVAVITAAIAASEGTSADGLVVRSIRRTGKSQWKRA